MASTKNRKLATALRRAIDAIPRTVAGSNKGRYVARHYFGLKGTDAHKRLIEWMRNPPSIPDAEIPKIREVLGQLAGGTPRTAPAAASAPAHQAPDHNRKVQKHAVSLLSSLKALVVDVDPSTVLDDTRMHVTSALETIASQFGIIARFTDPTEGKSRPATASDFASVAQPKGRSR